jgi:hypothetical protein
VVGAAPPSIAVARSTVWVATARLAAATVGLFIPGKVASRVVAAGAASARASGVVVVVGTTRHGHLCGSMSIPGVPWVSRLERVTIQRR